MKHLLVFMFFALSAFAENHFYFERKVPAAIPAGFNLPSSHVGRDTWQFNVLIQNPASFRIRTFLTFRRSGGPEFTVERDTRISPGDFWAAAYFQLDDVLNLELVRIRFKEEPEPAALAESTIEVTK